MNDQQHFMLKLQTLGSSPGAFILEIAVCQFFPFSTGPLQAAVKTPSCWWIAFDQPNGQIDPGAVAWWATQSNTARARVFSPASRVPMDYALMQFDRFVEGANDPIIWARPPSFDCVVLENAYKRMGLKTPWRPDATRCVSTICDTAHMEDEDLTTPSLAYEPGYAAIAQALDVCQAVRRLEGVPVNGVPQGLSSAQED